MHSDPYVDAIRFIGEEYVIRNEAEFASFISLIPKTEARFEPSPPPSQDALLRHPKIDFKERMLLVIVAHEPNCFVEVEIIEVKYIGETMHVLCHYGQPGQIAHKVISHGTYCAVLVNRFDGDVLFAQNSDSLRR